MKAIIIGAGIAGLSAGIFARQSGIETTIFELHNIPGGNCTSWKRKGYLFEGAMHWLTGSSPEVPIHALWKEVGALQDNNPIHLKDPFISYWGEQKVELYRDIDKLEKHFMQLSPEDEKAIKVLLKHVKLLGKLHAPVSDLNGLRTTVKHKKTLAMLGNALACVPYLKKLKNQSVAEYLSAFQHEGIRNMLASIVEEHYSAITLLYTLGQLTSGDGGYSKGGSLRFVKNMAKTYTDLGGEIHYKKRVERIELKNGKACGVWVDGKYHPADAVIVASDTQLAIDKFFESPLHESWTEEMRSIKPMACIFFALGVQADLKKYPERIQFLPSKPIEIAGQTFKSLGFINYASKEGYAPEGCSALTCLLIGDSYDAWKQLKAEGKYEETKEKAAQELIAELTKKLPEIEGKVEVWDMATPLTYVDYCDTYKGSWMSELRPDSRRMRFPSKSESIENLYFAGHRLSLPGGFSIALDTGRKAVQHLCKDRNLIFQCEYKN